MNRLVKLFQSRANVAYDKYLETRKRSVSQTDLLSKAWNDEVVRGAKLLTEAETWQKAADLLRKEELNRS